MVVVVHSYPPILRDYLNFTKHSKIYYFPKSQI